MDIVAAFTHPLVPIHKNIFREFFGCSFLLIVGSFLHTVELFYSQLTILAFLPTIGAFLTYNLRFLLTVGAFLLTVGKCV